MNAATGLMPDGPDLDEAHASAGEAASLPLTQEVRLLAQGARKVAEAEFAYQRARAAYAASMGRGIAILGVIAATFAVFAVMAAIVGTVIALGPVLGLWGAMAAVAGGILAVALLCALALLAKVRGMKAVLSEEGDNGRAG